MILFDWELVAWVDAFYVIWMVAMGSGLAFSAFGTHEIRGDARQ